MKVYRQWQTQSVLANASSGLYHCFPANYAFEGRENSIITMHKKKTQSWRHACTQMRLINIKIWSQLSHWPRPLQGKNISFFISDFYAVELFLYTVICDSVYVEKRRKVSSARKERHGMWNKHKSIVLEAITTTLLRPSFVATPLDTTQYILTEIFRCVNITSLRLTPQSDLWHTVCALLRFFSKIRSRTLSEKYARVKMLLDNHLPYITTFCKK